MSVDQSQDWSTVDIGKEDIEKDERKREADDSGNEPEVSWQAFGAGDSTQAGAAVR
jgi:hypothetical protein